MKYKIIEGFGQYKSASGVVNQAAGWVGSAPVISYASGPSGENEVICGNSSYINSAIFKSALSEAKRAFCGMLMRSDISTRLSASISLMSRLEYERAVTNITLSSPVSSAVRMVINQGAPKIYHEVLTAATGVAKNSILLAELPAIQANSTAWLYLAADFSDPDPKKAKVHVGIDGHMQTIIFDRERIINGYQAASFDAVCVVVPGPQPYGAYCSSIVAGDLESDEPDPLRVRVEEYSPGAELGISPANDATKVSISSTAWIDKPLSSGTTAATQLLAAVGRTRLSAVSGEIDAPVETAFEAGTNVFEIFKGSVPVSAVGMIKESHLDVTGLTPAQLRAGKFRFRSTA